MASSISLMCMYSSAVWLRVLSPGPIFIDGQGMRAWSLRVGLPKGVRPRAMALCRRGWSGEMWEEERRRLRGLRVLWQPCWRWWRISWLV